MIVVPERKTSIEEIKRAVLLRRAQGQLFSIVVVAEGVEEAGQLEFLRDCRCDQYQGFIFSAALPPGRFREILSGAQDTAALLN